MHNRIIKALRIRTILFFLILAISYSSSHAQNSQAVSQDKTVPVKDGPAALKDGQAAPAPDQREGGQVVEPIEVNGDEVNYSLENRKMSAKGNVKIVYEDIIIFCNKAEVDMDKKLATLSDNVKVVHKQGILYAERMNYDFENRRANILNLDIKADPFFGKAAIAEKLSDTEYTLKSGYVTTCDREVPHYRFTAKKIRFYPHQKVVAVHMIVKVGDIPIFYFPYFIQYFQDKVPLYNFTPGKDSEWGTFALNSFRYRFNEGAMGRIHLDYYEKRGLGRGVSHNYSLGNGGSGWAKAYYIPDRDRNNIDDIHEADRYKFQLRHYAQPTDRLKITAEYNKFSDIDFMRNFFRREYERDVHPLTYAYADYSIGDNSSMNLLAQKRVNSFYAETEYLPQFQYRLYPSRIADSNFYFDYDQSIGNLVQRYAYSSLSFRSLRADVHPVLSYRDHVGPLAIKPYVGVRDTYYSHQQYEEDSVHRFFYEAGTELSFKLSRLYSMNRNGELIKIRHILTPIIQYSFIRPPSVAKDRLIQFDSIDAITDQNKITFTLDNKIQTKIKDTVRDVLYFSPSVVYAAKSGETNGHFEQVSTLMEFNPLGNVSMKAYAVYDLVQDYLKEVDATFNLSYGRVSTALVYRKLKDDNTNKSELISDASITLNPKWQLKSYHQYDIKDKQFTSQQYMVRRDLHCWWFDFGIDVDSNQEKTFWVIFTLKAFPDVHVNFEKSIESSATSNP